VKIPLKRLALSSNFSVGFCAQYRPLTLILLTWRIWWAPNKASRWQMGFHSVFKGLILHMLLASVLNEFKGMVN